MLVAMVVEDVEELAVERSPKVWLSLLTVNLLRRTNDRSPVVDTNVSRIRLLTLCELYFFFSEANMFASDVVGTEFWESKSKEVAVGSGVVARVNRESWLDVSADGGVVVCFSESFDCSELLFSRANFFDDFRCFGDLGSFGGFAGFGVLGILGILGGFGVLGNFGFTVFVFFTGAT